MLVLVLGGGLRDDDVSTLSGRRVEDRVVVVARAALATHVVEEQLAELVAVAGCLTHLMLCARSTQSGRIIATMLTTNVGRNARTPLICPSATLRK